MILIQAKHKTARFFAVLLAAAVGILFLDSIIPQSGKGQLDTFHSELSAERRQNQDLSEDWALILVNADHPIPEDFSVSLKTLRNGQAVDSRIYPDLQEMLDDMRAEGLEPLICSSYRTQERQTQLFENQVRKYLDKGFSREQAEAEASKWSARPGESEHQTGLAVDLVSVSYQVLNEAQEQTAEQEWLLKNCWKYGFILRYPSEKSAITGISYEPWHYRYVGYAAAKEITERGICLEEYLDKTE